MRPNLKALFLYTVWEQINENNAELRDGNEISMKNRLKYMILRKNIVPVPNAIQEILILRLGVRRRRWRHEILIFWPV